MEDLAAIRSGSGVRRNCDWHDIPEAAASLGADRTSCDRSRYYASDDNLPLVARCKPSPSGVEEL
jgi:hypothetical protein